MAGVVWGGGGAAAADLMRGDEGASEGKCARERASQGDCSAEGLGMGAIIKGQRVSIWVHKS